MPAFIFIFALGALCWLVDRFATWEARRDFAETAGEETFQRGMKVRGIETHGKPTPGFWRFAFRGYR